MLLSLPLSTEGREYSRLVALSFCLHHLAEIIKHAKDEELRQSAVIFVEDLCLQLDPQLITSVKHSNDIKTLRMQSKFVCEILALG